MVSVDKTVSLELCDLILQSVVAFFEGGSLAQTVFTCLYLHDPSKVQDVSIRTLSYALLRLVSKLMEIVNTAAVYEEEDIFLMSYGFSFAQHIPEKVYKSFSVPFPLWLTFRIDIYSIEQLED